MIIGAGPAGSRCALELARRGLRVAVVERGRLGRDKGCGEGLMPRGARSLRRAGLGALLDGAPALRSIRLHTAGGVVEARFGDEPGRGVRRDRFDRALVEAAASCGAEPRFDVRLRSLERTARGFRLRADGWWLDARAIVGADGVRSWTRGALGLGGPSSTERRVGVVGHAPLAWRDGVDELLADGFQLAVTPVAGGVSLAALLEPWRARELAGDARGWLERAAASLGIAARIEAVLTTPLGGGARGTITDGALLVGDAASAIDPIVGCGISLALESAEAAAEALAAALDGAGPSRRALAGYGARRARLRRAAGWASTVGVALSRSPRIERAAARLIRPRLADALLARVGG